MRGGAPEWTEFWEMELERCGFIYICYTEMEDNRWVLCEMKRVSGCGGATFELEGNFLSGGCLQGSEIAMCSKGRKAS